jgi:hypothetical protein
MSRATTYFWDCGHLVTINIDLLLGYHVRPWFAAKFFDSLVKSGAFSLVFSKMSVKTVFSIVQQSRVLLSIDVVTPSIQEIVSLRKCKCYSSLV